MASSTALLLCGLALVGEIDDAMISQISASTCQKPEVSISSRGGDAGKAFKLVDILRQKHASVTIGGECMSSCAEIILPLVQKVRVEPGTLIVVHGNPIMKKFAAQYYKVPTARNCQFENANRLTYEYKKLGLNDRFWTWQLRHLPMKEFRVQSDAAPGTCPSFGMTFVADGIAVTKGQLETELGVRIAVQTCADIDGCVEAKSKELGLNLISAKDD